MFKVYSNTQRNMDPHELGKCLFINAGFWLTIITPLFILGGARDFSSIIKYRSITSQTCYGGNQIQDMSITPAIYNTSLTYYPAFLHLTTTTINRNGELVKVKLTYPTLFDIEYICECEHKGCERRTCEKMVGDVITKYDELRNELTFPCYIDDDQIVGLAGEQSIIIKNYRLVLAGICIAIPLGIWLLYLAYISCCINYVPIPENKVKPSEQQLDTVILIKQNFSNA